MPNMDDLLQMKLGALEKGAAPETALQDLPSDAEELKPLITLAAKVRELPHPQPSPEHTRVLHYKLQPQPESSCALRRTAHAEAH